MPSVRALPRLAQDCPCLEGLALPALDVADFDGRVTLYPPKEGTRGHPLRVLRVACPAESANIENTQAARVADDVDGLFPNMDTEQSWRHDGSVEALLSDWYLMWLALRSIATSEGSRRPVSSTHDEENELNYISSTYSSTIRCASCAWQSSM